MISLFASVVSLSLLAPALGPEGSANLLLNPDFGFHSFGNSRSGQPASYSAGAIPFWDSAAYGDCEVVRGPRVGAFRPAFPVDGVVVIHPGKRLEQTILLAEVGLDTDDVVSLSVRGHQTAPAGLEAAVALLRLDSATGTWNPKDFGYNDDRTFPKHSRGELIGEPVTTQRSADGNDFELAVENVAIVGGFTESANESDDSLNTIGLRVSFTNVGEQDVWVYAPCLTDGAAAKSRLPALRPNPTRYRGVPRTMQKLWRGEPLHIIAMGSSIDRGSANPKMFLYDETFGAETFKQPVGFLNFEGEKIGHPGWNDYLGWWQHYFMYTGRFRQALMAKYDYPIDQLLLNVMACDGSSISEAHSGLAPYATLALPPDPNTNGHAASGKSWEELYPAVFARPEGSRPDLVIFGSGANEKVDQAAEIAAFEGQIRWFQRHYPGIEFVFCMWQNRESYTPNTGHLMELALRYGIPYLDLGRVLDLTTRYCNSYALVPRDGHPQAAAHDIWARQLLRAFEAVEPIEFGAPQAWLPERVHPATLAWEGDLVTYPGDSPRLHGGNALVLDDAMVNLWADGPTDPLEVRVDGVSSTNSRRRPQKARDLRNSGFAIGNLPLGERHIVEVATPEGKIVAADCKPAFGRLELPVSAPGWDLGGQALTPFASAWGAPYGDQQVVLAPGAALAATITGDLLSIAYLDTPTGGNLQVLVDGTEVATWPTHQPFTLAGGEAVFLENRHAVRVPFGPHRVELRALEAAVPVLGLYAYDTRSYTTLR